MFKNHESIIKEALQSEIEIINKYYQQKEKTSLDIKEALETESKKKIQDQTLKTYDPVEIYNKISGFNIQYQNIITQQKLDLENLQIETEKKLLEEMKYIPKTPITEIYKDIYSGDPGIFNNRFLVCRVWFTLIKNVELKLNPGDPFRVAWYDFYNCINSDKKKYLQESLISKTSNTYELKIPNLNKNLRIIFDDDSPQCWLFPINHWGESSTQKTVWLKWVKENRPI